jgi:hypothetical protein
METHKFWENSGIQEQASGIHKNMTPVLEKNEPSRIWIPLSE